MKRLKRGMLPLFTLLLVAAGAAMPFAVSYMQDARQVDPEVRSFDSFSLTLREEVDLGRTLKIIAGSDYYIAEVQQAEDVRMTREEAQAAAEDLMARLIRFGLLDKTASSLPTIWPQVLCANDGSAFIPTWTLDWDMPAGQANFYVWLDDAAGKAILITIPSVRYSDNYIRNAGSEPIYASAENWRAFLEEYYGTDVQIAGEEWFDYAVRFALTFPLGASEDGEQANFQLDLYIYFLDGFTTLSPYVEPFAIPPENEARSDS